MSVDAFDDGCPARVSVDVDRGYVLRCQAGVLPFPPAMVGNERVEQTESSNGLAGLRRPGPAMCQAASATEPTMPDKELGEHSLLTLSNRTPRYRRESRCSTSTHPKCSTDPLAEARMTRQRGPNCMRAQPAHPFHLLAVSA